MNSYISYEINRKSAKLLWPLGYSVRIWNSLRKISDEKTAVQGEIGFADRSAFCGYIRESSYLWMDKSKWDICSYNSL